MAKSAAEQGARKRETERLRNQAKTRAANDISEIPFYEINWRRRLKAKSDLVYFARTYLPNVFSKKPAEYHFRLAEAIQEIISDGGKQSILLPRGGGKTMWSEAGALHALLYGKVKWFCFIGSNRDKGKEGFQTFKTWLKSPLLQQDFPELVYPIKLLETAEPGSVARSQTFQGKRTFISIDQDKMNLPCVVLPADVASWYRRHDADSVRKVEWANQEPFYLPKGAFGIFYSTGIECAIRGGNVQNPYTFESHRPQVCILDDIQNDSSAKSKMTVQKYMDLINSAIAYLAGAGETMGLLMPATVIETNDLADQLGNVSENPEWRGLRVPMVEEWPEGMNNVEISAETPTSRLWQLYQAERDKSLRKYGSVKDATKFYRKHRALMDKGFRVSWPERFTKVHASAIQEAMEFRFKDHKSFLTNCQQVGGDILNVGESYISAREFTEKQSETPRGVVPEDTRKIVAYVDIQREYFAYSVLAIQDNFSSVIVDYGTYPDLGQRFYKRRQANSWKLLSTEYLKAHPKKEMVRDTEGREMVNLAEMYTFNLYKFLELLYYQKFERYNTGAFLKIDRIACDSQEGTISRIIRDVVKKFPAEWALAYHGFGIRANRMGIDPDKRRPDRRYEDVQNQNVNVCRWMYKYSQESHSYELHSDVNAWKDFLFERLATPKGEPGSFELYHAPPHVHELYALQVCESEKPTEFEALGKKRNLWNPVPDVDNEFLDTLVGCCCLGSFEGCTYSPSNSALAITPPEDPKPAKSFRERLAERKGKAK